MLVVETAMRAYALRFGGDPEVWGVTRLIQPQFGITRFSLPYFACLPLSVHGEGAGG